MKKTICSLVLALSTGCSSVPLEREVYEVNKFKLICDRQEKIEKSYNVFTLYKKQQSNHWNSNEKERVAGFHVQGLRQIYVRWGSEKDKNGEPIPDFYTLGHELWHIIKGDYHE